MQPLPTRPRQRQSRYVGPGRASGQGWAARPSDTRLLLGALGLGGAAGGNPSLDGAAGCLPKHTAEFNGRRRARTCAELAGTRRRRPAAARPALAAGGASDGGDLCRHCVGERAGPCRGDHDAMHVRSYAVATTLGYRGSVESACLWSLGERNLASAVTEAERTAAALGWAFRLVAVPPAWATSLAWRSLVKRLQPLVDAALHQAAGDDGPTDPAQLLERVACGRPDGRMTELWHALARLIARGDVDAQAPGRPLAWLWRLAASVTATRCGTVAHSSPRACLPEAAHPRHGGFFNFCALCKTSSDDPAAVWARLADATTAATVAASPEDAGALLAELATARPLADGPCPLDQLRTWIRIVRGATAAVRQTYALHLLAGPAAGPASRLEDAHVLAHAGVPLDAVIDVTALLAAACSHLSLADVASPASGNAAVAAGPESATHVQHVGDVRSRARARTDLVRPD